MAERSELSPYIFAAPGEVVALQAAEIADFTDPLFTAIQPELEAYVIDRKMVHLELMVNFTGLLERLEGQSMNTIEDATELWHQGNGLDSSSPEDATDSDDSDMLEGPVLTNDVLQSYTQRCDASNAVFAAMKNLNLSPGQIADQAMSMLARLEETRLQRTLSDEADMVIGEARWRLSKKAQDDETQT